jgi:hypothetical protein
MWTNALFGVSFREVFGARARRTAAEAAALPNENQRHRSG